jgi:hypothetical protein
MATSTIAGEKRTISTTSASLGAQHNAICAALVLLVIECSAVVYMVLMEGLR